MLITHGLKIKKRGADMRSKGIRSPILTILLFPVFLFYNHVTPKILNVAIWGNGPGGPEFVKLIKTKERPLNPQRKHVVSVMFLPPGSWDLD